jgi:hypothetical protein
MRIFLSCQQALRSHPVPSYSYWEYYLRNALLEAGHELIETPQVDWAQGLVRMPAGERAAWLGQTWSRTVDFLREENAKRRVDLFLGYLFPDQVEPSAVQSVRSLGIPTVNFFCDNVREFTRVPSSFSGFDLHWVPEKEAQAMYASAGLAYVYAPMPIWVRPEFRGVDPAETGEIVFVGSHDDLREDLLGDAVERGLPVQIYGSGWGAVGRGERPPTAPALGRLANQLAFLRAHGVRGFAMRATYRFRRRRPAGWSTGRIHPNVFADGYFRTIRESQVVIGVNRCPSFQRPFSSPLRYSRLRDIEAPMLGACYLTEMAPGLEDLFEVGTEIEAYRDAGEMVEKAKRLQGDPARRSQLRSKAQRRALSEHTIARSIEKVARRLGIPQ